MKNKPLLFIGIFSMCATAHAVVRSPCGLVEVSLSSGTSWTESQVIPLAEKWCERFASPPALKSLSPRLNTLSFNDQSGFISQHVLSAPKEYLMSVRIPVTADKSDLAQGEDAVASVPAFISFLGKDARAKVIMQNNHSGRAIIISVNTSTQPWTLTASHPMHAIIWTPDAQRYEYNYTDKWQDVLRIREVKRIAGHKAVKALLREKPDDARVRVSGSEAEGFSFIVMSDSLKKRVAGTLIGGKVAVEE